VGNRATEHDSWLDVRAAGNLGHRIGEYDGEHASLRRSVDIRKSKLLVASFRRVPDARHADNDLGRFERIDTRSLRRGTFAPVNLDSDATKDLQDCLTRGRQFLGGPPPIVAHTDGQRVGSRFRARARSIRRNDQSRGNDQKAKFHRPDNVLVTLGPISFQPFLL